MRKTWIALFLVNVVWSPASAGMRQDRAKEAALLWAQCVQERAERFAPQPEPAETLITAAFGGCLSQASEFRHLYRETTREYGLSFSSPASDEAIDKVVEQIEQHIQIVQLRR